MSSYSWPLFYLCIYWNAALRCILFLFNFIIFCLLLSFQQNIVEWADLTSPWGDVSWLKVEAGRCAGGSLLTVAGGLSPLMGYWPPLVWKHEVAIHHRHVHVSSASSVPLLCDHPGRSGTRTTGAHQPNRLAFLFSLFLPLYSFLSRLFLPLAF